MQPSASLHDEPSDFGGAVHRLVVRSHVPTSWHWSSAKQSVSDAQGQSVAAGTHTPAWQLSPVVQVRLSLQVVSFGIVGFVHDPVMGSQVPGTWQASIAEQTTVDVAAPHTPAWQVSPEVHADASSQPVPSVFAGLLHWPVAPSQTPTSWHWSSAPHVTVGAGALQRPVARSHTDAAWQASA